MNKTSLWQVELFNPSTGNRYLEQLAAVDDTHAEQQARENLAQGLIFGSADTAAEQPSTDAWIAHVERSAPPTEQAPPPPGAEYVIPDPEPAADPEIELEPLTDIEQIELDNGFRFGDPDNEATGTPKPTRALICRNPECSNSGEHIAVHEDTLQPIHCGGIITNTADGTTRPCNAILLCDHETETREHTTGTLAAPIKLEETICTKCGTITAKTETPLPPIPLDSIPIELAEALNNGPLDGGGATATA